MTLLMSLAGTLSVRVFEMTSEVMSGRRGIAGPDPVIAAGLLP
jgi:hypothetical protein